jgi:SH3-like domain-containing protein
VIEEIVRNNSGPDEPSAWAKIVLPPGAHVWVNTAYIDASNQTVKPKKLNLRSGPGENYSVIGLLHRGDAVKTMTTKGDWTEIEPPASAYAFMAAQYLKQEPAAPTPTPTPPEPVPTPTTVAANPPVAPPPTETPVVPPAPETPAVTNAVTPPPAPAVEEPPPPRIVQREGIVRGMTSIQAPSAFKLVSPDNGRDIDYLYTNSKELDLRRYKGLRIIVTGEEGLDERWGNTPVLTIQKIQVLE